MNLVETTEGWPEDITPLDLLQRVKSFHHTPEDLSDGDLSDRIWAYSRYYLRQVDVHSIRSDEWTVHNDMVTDYADKFSRGEIPPPIIYDPVNDSLIDGTHRLNAAIAAGEEKVIAYIGDAATYEAPE